MAITEGRGMMAVSRHVAQAHEDGIWSCAWTKAGQIVTGSVDECCNVWDASSLAQKKNFKKNLLGVVSVVSDSTGGTIATSSIDSVLRFYDPRGEDSEPKGHIDAGPVEAWTLSFHPDDKTLCSGTQQGTINVWDVETCGKTQSFKGSAGEGIDAFVMSVAYSPDGAQVATGGLNGAVGIYDARTGESVAQFEGHELPVRGISWTPDGQVLLSACDDSTVQAYDVARPGKPFEVFYGHRSWCLNVACSPDNRHFATCSSDRLVRIFDLNTKTCVAQLEGHQDQIWEVAYNHDGTELVSCADDGAIQLYSIAAAQARDKERADKEKTTEPAHDKDATAAAPAPAAAA